MTYDPDDYDWAPDPNYCEDCGVAIDRHGSECGYELGDHAAGYFGAPMWGAP